MYQSNTQPPPGPETTEVDLYKPFHKRLAQLSESDQGRLAMAIIERFLHLDRQGKRQ